MNMFSVFVFAALLLLFIPTAYNTNENLFIAAISSIMDAVDSISFGNTLKDMNGRIFGSVGNLLTDTELIHRLYVSVLSILAPLLGVRAALIIFRDFFTQLRFLLNLKNNFHIFSELNNKSLILASDITQYDKKAKIIFCSADNNSKNIFLDKARAINGMLTRKSIVGFKINSFSSKKVHMYFIGADEYNNVRFALDKAKECEKINRELVILAFSSKASSECVIDVANEKIANNNIRIELFNEAQRTAYNLVYEYPVYSTSKDKSFVNIMILGAGKYGIEFAKASAWCSQMINTKFNIRLFDKQDKEAFLDFPFSELSEKLRRVDTELNTDFIMCDVFSEKFNEYRFGQADYIFIDLGEDELNISAALLMRKLYSRQSTEKGFIPAEGGLPKIVIHIRSTQTGKVAAALNDENIIAYGVFEDVFTAKNIYEWKIDKIAEFIHAFYYCKHQSMFNALKEGDKLAVFKSGLVNYRKQTELSKRSSRATAIHCKYKFYDAGIDLDRESLFSEESSERLDRLYDKLLRAEHNRWNVFHMLDGWDSWDKGSLVKNAHKNKKAKLHAYLARFDDLKEIAQQIYGEDIDPVEYDRMVIDVMRLAYLAGLYGEYDYEAISGCIDK